MATKAMTMLPELEGKHVKLSPNEAIRAAMDLHDPDIKTISLRGHDYHPYTNSSGCRTVRA